MRRKTLLLLTIIFAITGIIFSVIPFASSMHPSEKAKAARSNHDVSSLSPGDFILEKLGRKSAWNANVLIIRDWNGTLYSYLIPTDNGKVPMPEWFWGHGSYFCSEFGPEIDEQKRLKKSGVITCHDQDIPDWGKETWRWAYDGKSKTSWVTDMYAPGFEVKENVLYINI